jgi:hypothetical protein
LKGLSLIFGEFMKHLLILFIGLLSLNSWAKCDRHYIVYIENQTEKEIDIPLGEDNELTLNIEFLKTIQEQDLHNIMDGARTVVPNKCRHYINGHDLVPNKRTGKSKLDKLYADILNDGSNSPVDMFSLTHGSKSGKIEVLKATDASEMSTAEKALFDAIPDALRPRLGIFVNTACYGLSTNIQAVKAGFATSVGSDDETLGPLLLREFLRHYLDGMTLKETANEVFEQCIYDEVWKTAQAIGIEQDDHEAYCKNAIFAVVGDSAIDVSYSTEDLQKVRTEHLEKIVKVGKEFDGNAGHSALADDEKVKKMNEENPDAFYKPVIPYRRQAPLDMRVTPSYQFGANQGLQLDMDFQDWRVFKYVQISNINIGTQGYIGGRLGFLDTESLSIMNLERNPRKGILFALEVIKYRQSIFVTGNVSPNGFQWKYALSATAKAGYLVAQDKHGKTAHIANIGGVLNNQLEFRYRNFVMDNNVGVDLTPFSMQHTRFYANSKLQYEFGGHRIGAYGEYDTFYGNQVGVAATINLETLFGGKKKRKAKRRY